MRKQHYPDLPFPAAVEFLTAFFGEKLGEGATREVYTMAFDNQWVIKYDSGMEFGNVAEHRIWVHVEGTPIAKFFAECRAITIGGRFLIMRRTQPIDDPKHIPTELPDFLRDVKYENFGWVGRGKNRRVVCHDYAHNAIYRGLGSAGLIAKDDPKLLQS